MAEPRTGVLTAPRQPWDTGGLSPYDDLPLHQTADVLRRPVDQRWNWMDRWYFNLCDDTGALFAIIGSGYFPNTGIVESYLCYLVDGGQVNVRSWDRVDARGPVLDSQGFRFEMVEPMRRWRVGYTAAELALDLTFDADGAPYHFRPFWRGPDTLAGDEVDRWQHFVQFGTLSGVLRPATPREFTAAPGVRDRSWGVRSRRPRLHTWCVMRLGTEYFTLVHQERDDGTVLMSEAALVNQAGDYLPLVVDRHELRFDRASRQLAEAQWWLHDPRGRPVRLSYERAGESVRILGAGYDDRQGRARGDEPGVQTDRWDLADPATVARIGVGTMDTPVRAAITVDGVVHSGQGVVETAIARGHHRYGRQVGAPR